MGRRLTTAFSALLVLAGLAGRGPGHPPPHPADRHQIPPVSTSPGDGGAAPWVDVFVGTGDANVKGAVLNGKSGSTFPGPSLPFGMVQWSPDTPSAAPP